MFNVVQGKTLRLDQHSAELIEEGQPLFRFPIFGMNGGVIWKGCYGTPNTALAGLKAYSDKKKLNKEKHDELVDVFTASVVRIDKDDSATKDIPLTISMAPPHTLLKIWGGSLSHKEYHDLWDSQGLMSKVFRQHIPEQDKIAGATGSGMSGVETSAPFKNIPNGKQWKCLMVPFDGKCTDEFLQQLPTVAVEPPRNLCNALREALVLYDGFMDPSVPRANPNCFCVYVHPEKKNVFAFGDPSDFEEGRYNKLANKIMGKQTVFGDVLVMTKQPITNVAKKRKGKQVTTPTGSKGGTSSCSSNSDNSSNGSNGEHATATVAVVTTTASPPPAPRPLKVSVTQKGKESPDEKGKEKTEKPVITRKRIQQVSAKGTPPTKKQHV